MANTRINIADNWQNLSGSNNWSGMLNPLNVNLSKWITLCGERVQAIYDSIQDDRSSPRWGQHRYGREEFFSKVGLESDQPCTLYAVSKYIYVAPAENMVDVIIPADWARTDGAWIGYVAVATDDGKTVLGRRDVLVCWRGTTFLSDWSANFQYDLEPATDIVGQRAENPMVHKGFLAMYNSAKDQVRVAVTELLNKHADEELSITVSGHSLGAALATLNAVDIVANQLNKLPNKDKVIMVTALVFASPKVGDQAFTEVFNNQSNLHLLHIRHRNDPVPNLPSSLTNYQRMGFTLEVKSTYTTSWKLYDVVKLVLSLVQVITKFHSLKNYLTAVTNAAAAGRGARMIEQEVVLIEMKEDGTNNVTYELKLSDTTSTTS